MYRRRQRNLTVSVSQNGNIIDITEAGGGIQMTPVNGDIAGSNSEDSYLENIVSSVEGTDS